MKREENKKDTAEFRGYLAESAPHAAVFLGSYLVGFLVICALTIPMSGAPPVPLIARYSSYSVLFAWLFRACDRAGPGRGLPGFSLFSGPSSAAATSGFHLFVNGIPVTTIFCLVVLFGVAFGVRSCLSAHWDDVEEEIVCQLNALSMTALVFTLAVLAALLANALFA